MSGWRALGRRPEQPWRPTTFQVFGTTKRVREVWVKDGRTGEKVRRQQPRFDVRYRVDGHDFRYGFDQRGWAESFVNDLRKNFAQGWLFDPDARRFLDPASSGDAHELTMYDHARDYLSRKWRSWQPATRPPAQRDLARACMFLVRDDAPRLSAGARVEADAYLRDIVLTIPAPEQLSSAEQEWDQWFLRWSLPLRAITDEHLHAFMEDVRTRTLDGKRRELAESSVARTRAVVRAAFTYARKRRLIEWDPWEPVEAPSMRDRDRVDADLVMSPAQVRQIGEACADIDSRYRAFVLVQGLCGLRPGEAIELRRRDINVEAGNPISITARGTHLHVPERYLMPGEDRRRPLKGRGKRASRTIPLPQELRPVLKRHLAEHVAAKADAHMFTTPTGKPLNLSNFQRDVWTPAREAGFAEGDPLRGARRHDLRHAAITAWLNAGVPLKTAQAWSGHRTVSVLLDTYLGVICGDEAVAMARFEALLNPTRADSEMVTRS